MTTARLIVIQCQVHAPVPLDNGAKPPATCYLHHDGTWHCLHCHRGGFWDKVGDGVVLRIADTMPVRIPGDS